MFVKVIPSCSNRTAGGACSRGPRVPHYCAGVSDDDGDSGRQLEEDVVAMRIDAAGEIAVEEPTRVGMLAAKPPMANKSPKKPGELKAPE